MNRKTEANSRKLLATYYAQQTALEDKRENVGLTDSEKTTYAMLDRKIETLRDRLKYGV